MGQETQMGLEYPKEPYVMSDEELVAQEKASGGEGFEYGINRLQTYQGEFGELDKIEARDQWLVAQLATNLDNETKETYQHEREVLAERKRMLMQAAADKKAAKEAGWKG